ncbi:transcriptional activator FtrA [Streptomyces sp. YIM 130001]|uniref:helix-turn-helix domain-containing protein n=1 Tax=Streptomyces sp. YIM 130001 TaxID=2259644 RepID=UPI000E65A224|nr:AraC family transcriptional regulator [Streptomyces sp. YIM 130001]RII22127.1 transcriptional activator FtrA [Streptomyces sp. YIM 130001]
MAGPRRDTRGIVDAAELFTHVRFRRYEPAGPLRPYVDNYWLIDWDLTEPYASHIVPHPSVNLVFQRFSEGTPDFPGVVRAAVGFGEVAGVALGLFTQKLEGRGRVCGVKFRPGGFRPFAPERPVSEWTGRRVLVGEVFSGCLRGGLAGASGENSGGDPGYDSGGYDSGGDDGGGGDDSGHECGGGSEGDDPTGARAAALVLDPEDDLARVAALDAFLLTRGPRPDPRADLAVELAERIRTDGTALRVGELSRGAGLSVRSLQRLFAAYVGVGPKWVVLRHRIHQALEHAESAAEVDWPTLAADLGYADQAHLVRDFTATVGVPPTAYVPKR